MKIKRKVVKNIFIELFILALIVISGVILLTIGIYLAAKEIKKEKTFSDKSEAFNKIARELLMFDPLFSGITFFLITGGAILVLGFMLFAVAFGYVD
ncbi:hypothetical protein [Fictibacillus halophilus]|uniref:hypothetical protein n=1 Tax=Fictibacillus halophilus TaxID=1610490 RepID=UPI001CFA8559|nr:hypothetical protein [Fictibacillus halophilus]